jgi:hypothetical protein
MYFFGSGDSFADDVTFSGIDRPSGCTMMYRPSSVFCTEKRFSKVFVDIRIWILILRHLLTNFLSRRHVYCLLNSVESSVVCQPEENQSLGILLFVAL